MRVLLVHNRYRSRSPSGEDVAFDNECALLRSGGHDVITYTRDNDSIGAALKQRLEAARSLFWSPQAYADISTLIAESQPDIAHFHNTFPLVSASGYAACRRAAVPVVQTLHNYRLICPGALLLRDGRPCEDCVGRLPLPGVLHGCYRGSRAATALLTGMLGVHRIAGTYQTSVDRYICLTEFARQRFIRGGLPAERLVVKANGLADPPAAGIGAGGYALFVGRLGPEKGVGTLLRAWSGFPDLPLCIVGDGPMRLELEQQARTNGANVQFLGTRPRAEVLELMRNAGMLIIPSECYEGFPVTSLEAMACGTPMIVSAIGALDEILQARVQCLKFPPGDAVALRACVMTLCAQPELLQQMRIRARQTFDSCYAPAHSTRALINVYQDVLAARPTDACAIMP